MNIHILAIMDQIFGKFRETEISFVAMNCDLKQPRFAGNIGNNLADS